MIPNKHEQRYKYYLGVQRKLWEVEDKIRAIPLIPYDKPVPKGWLVNFELRKDILSRDDAPYILAAMQVGYKPQYIGNVKHVRMMRAGQKGFWQQGRRGRVWVKFGPHVPHLTQKEYDKLHPAVQKFFHLDRWNFHHWYRDKYIISLPEYWLLPKARTRYLTHYRDIDPELESQKKWLRDQMETYWREYGHSYSKSYPAHKDRARVRDAISKFKKREIDDIPNEKVPLEYEH
jgi:hypothetical protein